jgi:septum formation protein
VHPHLGRSDTGPALFQGNRPLDRQIALSHRIFGKPGQVGELPVAAKRGTGRRSGSDMESPRVVRSLRHGGQFKVATTRRHDNGAMPVPRLILASTSRYRRDLLSRLRLPFEVQAPGVEETPHQAEAPAALAMRLAVTKARAVAARAGDAVVIGSDQVAELGGRTIGKPQSHERAREQLAAMSAQRVLFHTAVAVVHLDGNFERALLAPVAVTFRRLGGDEIERYLRLDTPYDCAGSAKSEALGVALLESIESDDPTALIGLPLIRTCALLREAGLDPLGP